MTIIIRQHSRGTEVVAALVEIKMMIKARLFLLQLQMQQLEFFLVMMNEKQLSQKEIA
jgi:hypothetical protein